MEKAEKIEFIRVRLEAAHRDIAGARQNLDLRNLHIAVSRAYYAVFHVTSAALAWQDVKRTKHSGVESSFGELLVKTKLIEPEFFAIYRKAREVREEADYHPELKNITVASATQAIADAERFVQRIERYLKEVGAM